MQWSVALIFYSILSRMLGLWSSLCKHLNIYGPPHTSTIACQSRPSAPPPHIKHSYSSATEPLARHKATETRELQPPS